MDSCKISHLKIVSLVAWLIGLPVANDYNPQSASKQLAADMSIASRFVADGRGEHSHSTQ